MALAGNKCDLPPEHQRVDSKLSQELAKKYDMIWSEVSAKTGQGLPEMFGSMARRVFDIKTKEMQ